MSDTNPAPEIGSFRIVTDRTPGYDDVARAFGYHPDTGAPMTDDERRARWEGLTDGRDH